MPTNKELEKKVSELADQLEKIKENVDKLVALEIAKPQKDETHPQPMPANNIPVPSEYRAMVDEILNKDFGAQITYNSLDFAFTIIVPEVYRNLSAQEQESNAKDLRTKVIRYSDGANGVKEWINLVYSSFNPEMKAKIASDKQ